ncbi:tRNA1(Val) (adenine(37)-N6)-methyltransferase [Ileibacterium valens]|uniref:tRNA1(Val) (adenine(37)-N6)-methyltransferase n=1 Tax=Ileibacterium valens TaxID=1862668 RepID=UPI00272C8BA8|nr:methyltransferase [Ileibacterium valens]
MSDLIDKEVASGFAMDTQIEIFDPEHPVQLCQDEKKNLRRSWLIEPEYFVDQNRKHFCFNSDTSLLAEFIRLYQGERFLEIGCNNAALLVYVSKYNPAVLHGIEILKEPARLAAHNLQAHHLKDWMIFCQDIRQFNPGSDQYDVIASNPPFFSLEESGYPDINNLNHKKLGRIEVNLNLADLIQKSSQLLRSNGRFYLVHRPERIMEIMVLLDQNNLGLSRMGMVYDHRDSQCKSVLIEATKERKSRTVIEDLIWIGSENVMQKN